MIIPKSISKKREKKTDALDFVLHGWCLLLMNLFMIVFCEKDHLILINYVEILIRQQQM